MELAQREATADPEPAQRLTGEDGEHAEPEADEVMRGSRGGEVGHLGAKQGKKHGQQQDGWNSDRQRREV